MKDNFLTSNAIKYTVESIFNIMGLKDESVIISDTKATIVKYDLEIDFYIMNEQERHSFFAGNLNANYVSSYDGEIEIPIFCSDRFIEVNQNNISVKPDIITIAFALLSRFEEIIFNKKDKFGRFSYYDSLAYKYNFINIPIVDEYAMILREELLKIVPNLEVEKRNTQIIPTHDVDVLWRFNSKLEAFKSILGGDLLIRKSPKIAFNSFKELIKSHCKIEKDPYFLSCIDMMNFSIQNNLKSIFYFLGYKDGQDKRYEVVDDKITSLMKLIKKNECVVGFHGGFGSYDDCLSFELQKKQVEIAYENKITIGRQHYLCYDVKQTLKIWKDNGIKEDQTLGFFDQEGFRCGTCHPYNLYDFELDNKSQVIEHPLILMDATIINYRHISIEEAMDSAMRLFKRVLAVEGDCVILWHNDNVTRGMELWYNDFYKQFIYEAIKLKNRKE